MGNARVYIIGETFELSLTFVGKSRVFILA
jgi:hypothetical protein